MKNNFMLCILFVIFPFFGITAHTELSQTLNRDISVFADEIDVIDLYKRPPYKVSSKRRKHILDGDNPSDPRDGHGPNRGKTIGAFPDTWTDDYVIAAIERVANSPNSTWKQSSGRGYRTAPVTKGSPDSNAPKTTSRGTPVRFRVKGRDHSITIEVIIEPDGEGIITAYKK